jgi:hypothetical protein
MTEDNRPKVTCGHCGTQVLPTGVQAHIRKVHPEYYVPKKPGRKTAAAVEPLPVDEVVGVIIKALYGDTMPVTHVVHVVKLREDVQTFMNAVSK